MSIQVVAIATPAPGKEARVKEILSGLADNVAKNESGVLKYEIFEQYGGANGNVLVVEETYENQAALDNHFKQEYVANLTKLNQEESLLAAPLDIKTIKPFGGFASR